MEYRRPENETKKKAGRSGLIARRERKTLYYGHTSRGQAARYKVGNEVTHRSCEIDSSRSEARRVSPWPHGESSRPNDCLAATGMDHQDQRPLFSASVGADGARALRGDLVGFIGDTAFIAIT